MVQAQAEQTGGADVQKVESEYNGLMEKVKAVGQEHLLKFWSHLDIGQKQQLANQLNAIDLPRVQRIFKEYSTPVVPDVQSVQPLSSDHHGCAADCTPDTLLQYWNTGLGAIAANKVAVVVLAGGQATRLGAAQPKGTLSLQLLQDQDTLLQLQAQQIAKLQTLAKQAHPDSQPIIQWYVMTSSGTRAATQQHLTESVLPGSGLQAAQVHVFAQGELPCYTTDGQLMLANQHTIATAPDGNGGLYSALSEHIANMQQCGVCYVHVYCVDNILCRVADPSFIGYCIHANADCAAKVVSKSSAKEAVGVVCQVNGVNRVLEYSEISEQLANQKDAQQPDKLAFRAGNIANHYFTIEFLKDVCAKELPFHPAHKKIGHVDEQGSVVQPKTANGIKMEQFVFDVFQHAKSFYIWEVARSDEFSPLKNAESAGVECMSSCRRDLWTLHADWLRKVGAVIGEGKDTCAVEIPAALSYAGEGLEVFNGRRIEPPQLVALP